MPHRARALLGGTIALGAMTVLVASFRTDSGSLRMLAVLAAAAALSELFTIPADRGSLHPLDAHGFSLSASVHVAAILILGPWPAALVATFGVVAADSLARVAFHKVAYNASVFALAALSGRPRLRSTRRRPGDDLPAGGLSGDRRPGGDRVCGQHAADRRNRGGDEADLARRAPAGQAAGGAAGRCGRSRARRLDRAVRGARALGDRCPRAACDRGVPLALATRHSPP